MLNILIYSYAIFSSLKTNKNKKLPELGSVVVKHSIPNRLRLYSPKLKNIDLKNFILEEFQKINLIYEVLIDERSGSLLIKYDSNKIDENLLFMSCVRLIDGEINQENFKKKSIISQELINCRNALDNSIYTKTFGILDLDSLLILSLFYSAFKSYKKNNGMGSPSAYTLLFWTYNQLKERKWI